MKRFKRCIFIPLLMVLLSCESVVDELNTDPNNPAQASATLLLTGLQLGNISIHEGHTARVAGLWSGYFTGIDRQYRDIYFYNASGGLFNVSWQNIYYGVLQQTKLLEEQARLTNNRVIAGIAKVVKAHAAGAATSGWGDVPFAQAADIAQFPNPVFDKQEDIYKSLQKLLDDAIADLETNQGTTPGVADIHFGGNTTKWIDVAHTLKARFYLDVRDYANAYKEAQLGIKNAEGSLLAPHGTSSGINENFYFTGRSITDIDSQGAYITTILDPASAAYRGDAKTDERARLNFYLTYTEANGVKSSFKHNYTSTATKKGVFAQDAPFPLITFQENQLILAEAGYRVNGLEEGLLQLNKYRAYLNEGGYIGTTYREGNFKYEPYVAADFTAGGIANKKREAAGDALLREILEERYITFFGQILGFNDLRRTRKEAVVVPVPANNGSVLPERFVYAQDEVNSNTNAPNPVPGVFEPTPVNKK
ncbi:SusD/RagB family nutrient-binding outer membrane lipoprotein [Dyadobacter chenhuakuii]|uniref:SusD/RagB family nutrient-binding outer membrane lipoprotein n=1 Tax=Dyadobacter chenhuakuii TaxID=2909339 RepID=A0ABY4XQY5_9BACT|nr:SusD/RagB family nutrient-binding outer membrane lipoprotein [Dyadobacter chenhuakuii]MCF2492860.1 SusD/RagB family nutrient-binding outer membrane lipoprotein [Dyadobacter chenhuakuii]USJ32850.1 SusD/RagB family nutrient-binding outer membrane lipoprotein [Dyadobacter chenhuakuii]